MAALRSWKPGQFVQVGEAARPLVAHFHEYLLRGGFPQTAMVETWVTLECSKFPPTTEKTN